MIILVKKIRFWSLLAVMTCFTVFSSGQVKHLEVNGKVQKGNKPAGAVNIEITSPGVATQNIVSKENGKFDFKLDLQKNYLIKFSKGGLVSKVIEFNTKLPPDQADIIYEYPFNVELFDDLGGISKNDAMTKPVARIAYNPTYENFMDDENYTRQIKSQQDQARKAAEEIHKQQEKQRLDSLNKLWSDSLARSKSNEAKLLAEKGEQERLRKEQEKARNDSIDKVNAASLAAAAAAAAKQKARLDQLALEEAKANSLAETREKARLDSIARADAEKARQDFQSAAREKASLDSLERVTAEKNRRDSLQAVKEAAAALLKQEAEAKQRDKSRLDSINQAEAALKARQKFVTDSLALAKQDEDRRLQKEEAMRKAEDKQRLDSLAKAEAESNRKNEAAKLREKNKAAQDKKLADDLARQQLESKRKQDSMAVVKAREKITADSIAQAKMLDDKKAKEEKDKLEAEEKRLQKEKLDKKIADNIAVQERQKVIADSTQKALADANAKNALAEQIRIKRQQDSLASVKEQELKKSKEEEEIRRQQALLNKARQDSTARANAEQKQKAEEDRQRKIAEDKAKQEALAIQQREQALKDEADRKAKVLAEIEAKKKLLSKSNTVEGNTTPPPKTVAPVPKIRDSDYREGVTDETINESNRIIYRTVVKKDGTAFNYQKIAYNWGGVFYFKNDVSITESSFNQDIKNAKNELK